MPVRLEQGCATHRRSLTLRCCMARWRKPARIRIGPVRDGMFNRTKTALTATAPTGHFSEAMYAHRACPRGFQLLQ